MVWRLYSLQLQGTNSIWVFHLSFAYGAWSTLAQVFFIIDLVRSSFIPIHEAEEQENHGIYDSQRFVSGMTSIFMSSGIQSAEESHGVHEL